MRVSSFDASTIEAVPVCRSMTRKGFPGLMAMTYVRSSAGAKTRPKAGRCRLTAINTRARERKSAARAAASGGRPPAAHLSKKRQSSRLKSRLAAPPRAREQPAVNA